MGKKFYEEKTLFEMTPAEWESLCDGCGLCCLAKVEDEDTGQVYLTSVHCRLLDPQKIQCTQYKQRKKHVSECIVLTPKKVKKLDWLPKTCAYRLISEGKPLYSWHPLVSGRKDSVYKKGPSAKRYALLNETKAKDLRHYLIEEL